MAPVDCVLHQYRAHFLLKNYWNQSQFPRQATQWCLPRQHGYAKNRLCKRAFTRVISRFKALYEARDRAPSKASIRYKRQLSSKASTQRLVPLRVNRNKRIYLWKPQKKLNKYNIKRIVNLKQG